MQRRCIVCVGTAHEWFVRGVERLEASLRHVGWDGGVMTWKGMYPPGSPTQEQVDHGMKPYAVRAAYDAGYRTVMWLDASVWAVQHPGPIFEHAERTGHYVVYNGCWVGEWSTDRSLALFGITREEALRIRDVASGFICLDLTNALSMRFLDEWQRYTVLDGGAAFNGKDTNADGTVSKDPRVKGHRHDQTVAALILHQMGVVDCVPFGQSFIDGGHRPRPGKLLTYNGM